ncbi:MAG: hypothetical protein WCK14_06300 [Actinomycetota bacterium]
MNRFVTGTFALGLGFGATFGAFKMSEYVTTRQTKDERLGSIDFGKYCDGLYGHGATSVNMSNDIYGWVCTYRRNEQFSVVKIDADQACALLYPGDTYAKADDPRVETSWNCLRGKKR